MNLRRQTGETRDVVVPFTETGDIGRGQVCQGNTPSSAGLAEFDTPTVYNHVFKDVCDEALFIGLDLRREVCTIYVDLGIVGICI